MASVSTSSPSGAQTPRVRPLASDQSPARRVLRRLLRHRSAQIGAVLLGFLVVVAIFADLIAPYKYDEVIKLSRIKRTPPCVHALGCDPSKPQFLFGVDSNSRDLFSRVVHGSRLSLQIGLVTVSIAIVIGTLIGAVAGYAGGIIDSLLMLIMDVFQAFPSLLLAIAIVSVLGSGLRNTLLAVGIVSIPVFARVVRASVLTVKENDFITASRALGASNARIIVTRLLPNALTPLIVQGTLSIATTILEAAGLSFLGLGAQPPLPEWGLMLGVERNSVFNAPHLLIFPGVAIMITVLAFNLLGDGLRDALDPRRKV
jgi:ABC-type dipeptide/oligopeptide/nickel transport system permease subunit